MQIKLEWLELGSGSSRYSNCYLPSKQLISSQG